MVGDSTKNLIKVIFRALLPNYPENMTEKIKGSNFAFNCVDKLYYGCSKIALEKGGTYINFPD